MKTIIGAQYYTIRDYCNSINEFDDACKRVSEIGYRAVQLSGIGDFSGEEIKAILDKYGLYAICTHRSVDKFLNHLDEEIKFHKTINCPIMGLGSMPGCKVEPGSIDKFAEDFKPIIKKINEAGLTFAYHNHSFEFEKIDGKYVFDIMCEKLGDVPLKLILDVYWLAYSGINPAKFIRERKENIACLHFKDLAVKHFDHYYASVGEGNLDWEDILEACEDAGIEYGFVEQDLCYDENPFECLKKSYKFLIKKGLKA